ncbi:hypothetical protein C8R46DRAFT_1042870 [Mycena filopes]|nr:hypothetical protein C8R46DRAFT_1042870 [Mycena filopes]
MYWDHLITLGGYLLNQDSRSPTSMSTRTKHGVDDEISFLWKRARSASAGWFFAVRYAGFAGNIPVTVFTFYTMAPKWCHAYHIGHQVVLVGAQLLVSLVMLLRVHALYGRSVRLMVGLGGIVLLLVGVVLWSMQDQRSTPIEGFPGCHVQVAQSTSYRRPPQNIIGLAAAWEALFTFDALIFGLTVFKTYSMWRRGETQVPLPIHRLILRDGALYFAAMACANLCNILTFYPVLAGSLSTFASCASVAIMSRLMLNLHQKADAGVLTPHLHISLDDDTVALEVFDPGPTEGGIKAESGYRVVSPRQTLLLKPAWYWG